MKRALKTMLTIFNIAVLCFALVIAVNSASYEDKTVVTVYDDNGGDTGEIFLGLSKTIFARVASGSSINRNVTWSSSNNDVAKVNNGVVTALKKGTADIIATSGNASAVYKVTVVDENSTYEYNGTTYNYVWEKGTWGNNIKWYYCVGKRLIITGKGDMQEPPGHVSQIPWLSIDDSISIEIQEGITSICTYAFGAMEACEIRIPSTITKIGRNAFYCFQSQSNWQKWYFGGTPKQWNDIEIGMYNDGLPSVPDMYCRATGHIYNSVATASTCTDKGYTTYTCECGDSYVADYVSALGHNYTSKITAEPTHLTEGVIAFTCNCGDSYVAPVEKIKSHTYEAVVTEPTCIQQGYTTYICECGDRYISDYTDKTEHIYISQIMIVATHLEEGLETFTCQCGDSYTKPIPKLFTHLHEALITQPTCTEQGYTTYKCECGDIYIDDYVSEIGHYDNNFDYLCDDCGVFLEAIEDNTDCSCICHKNGIVGMIWRILRFFYKYFNTNQTCFCGEAHY